MFKLHIYLIILFKYIYWGNSIYLKTFNFFFSPHKWGLNMSLSQKRDPRSALPSPASFLLVPFNLQIPVSLPTPALASKYMGTHALKQRQTEAVTHRCLRKLVSSENGAWNIIDGQSIRYANVIWEKEGEHLAAHFSGSPGFWAVLRAEVDTKRCPKVLFPDFSKTRKWPFLFSLKWANFFFPVSVKFEARWVLVLK